MNTRQRALLVEVRKLDLPDLVDELRSHYRLGRFGKTRPFVRAMLNRYKDNEKLSDKQIIGLQKIAATARSK